MTQIPHNYKKFAESYSKLGFENTYFLAFRDLPLLLQKYTRGTTALDHGCGAGRSSRFLKQLGYSVVGADINSDMVATARRLDPAGDYKLLSGTALPFPDCSFDVVFQSCVAAEISERQCLNAIYSEIARVLKVDGIAMVVTGIAEHRRGEWASFIYKPNSNDAATSGAQIELAIRGTNIVLFDYNWYHQDFDQAFRLSSLVILERHRPLATGEEPFTWYQELAKPFWDIYVLSRIH